MRIGFIAGLGLSTPQGKDSRVDINDLYAFSNGDDTVLIMTVGPLAGSGIPGTGPAEFHPKGKYEFLIDDDGDAKKRSEDPDQVLEGEQ